MWTHNPRLQLKLGKKNPTSPSCVSVLGLVGTVEAVKKSKSKAVKRMNGT